MAVDILVSSSEFPRVLLYELLASPGLDSALPNRSGRSLQEEQFASNGGKPPIVRFDVVPLHHARTNAVSKVQGVDQHKAPRARVLLHARMQPFNHPNDALEMTQIFVRCQSAIVLRNSQ